MLENIKKNLQRRRLNMFLILTKSRDKTSLNSRNQTKEYFFFLTYSNLEMFCFCFFLLFFFSLFFFHLFVFLTQKIFQKWKISISMIFKNALLYWRQTNHKSYVGIWSLLQDFLRVFDHFLDMEKHLFLVQFWWFFSCINKTL